MKFLDISDIPKNAQMPVDIMSCKPYNIERSTERNAPLAQLVEQLTLNQWARGSSPRRRTKRKVPR